MAKTRVRATARNVGFQLESIKRMKEAVAQDPNVQRKLREDFRRFNGRQMTQLVTDYYQEAINQAAALVGRGVPGASKDQPVGFSTRFGFIDFGTVWGALNSKYRKMKERKYGTGDLFWKRTGATGRFLLSRAVSVRNAQQINIKARPPSANAKHDLVLTATIVVPSCGDPVIDALTREAFASGAITDVSSRFKVEEGAGRTISDTIAITEARRPLLSVISAGLGQRARKALSRFRQ